MSTIIQIFQESQFMESSKVIKLKVSTNTKDESNNELKMKNISADTKTEYGNKGFLDYLSNISSTPNEIMDNQNVYIHTLSKFSSSRLSEKSLQLCTENLGCETGSFMTDSSILSSSSSSSSSRNGQEQRISKKQTEGSYSMKKVKSFGAFPPPLTTMCGEKALQIRSIREGGRLITKAVEIPSRESCFVADRSDGRLKLRFVNDFESEVDDVQVSSIDEDEEENKRILNEKSQFKDDDDDEDDDDDDDNEECEQIIIKEVVNYDVEVENNNGNESFRRFVRCKECKKGLSNWEPMLVATS